MTPSFVDPFESALAKDLMRTTIIYHRKTVLELSSLRGRKGTLQTTVSILLKKLHDELKRNNISTYDPDAYESAVAGITLVLGRTDSPPPSGNEPPLTGETSHRNDGRGTGSVGCEAEAAFDVPADAHQSFEGSSRKKRRKDKGTGV